MNHLASFAFAFGLALLGAACAGGADGKLMVDHPMYEHQPPEGVGDDDADADEDEDEPEDEGDDEGTEE